MTQEPWFDTPVPGDDEPEETISDQRTRTLRQQRRLAAGRHPLIGGLLAKNGETCGSCDLLEAHMQSRRWYKCKAVGGHSPATDVRLSWPACSGWRPRGDA